MKHFTRINIFILAIALLRLIGHGDALAQGTAFSYQGRLIDSGSPATGTYDIRLAIYDAETGGTAVGGPLTYPGMIVSNGVFSITPDFGAAVFNGAARWLEISVRTNGSVGAFTALARQAVLSTPYAIRAANFGGAITDAQLSGNIPRLNSSSLNFTGAVQLTNPSNQLAGSFSGNAGGLSNLNSSRLTGALTVQGTPVNVGHTNHWNSQFGTESAFDVAVSGHYAFVTYEFYGLRIYDVSNPARPTVVARVGTNTGAYAIALSGDYAYMADFERVHILNAQNPAAPVSVASIADENFPSETPHAIAVAEPYLYVRWSQSLRIYDISTPYDPFLTAQIPLTCCSRDMVVEDGLLFVVNSQLAVDPERGLQIYNVSDPYNPVLVGHTNNGGTAAGITVRGRYAYLANGSDGLRIYDISNPANPINVGHIDLSSETNGFTESIALAGNLAYVAHWDEGLRTYDISDPANPIHISHNDEAGNAFDAYAWDVAVSGNHAYLANGSDGMRVYRLGLATAPAFQGDGSLLTRLDAANLSGGTMADARLSSNVALLNASQTFTGTNRFSHPSNVFVGVFTGNGAALTALNASSLATGTVPDARIDAALARDSEVLPTVLASDGAGSGLDADRLDGLDSSAFWKLGGNAGTVPGTHFVGTTDNQALEIKVNSTRVQRFEAPTNSPNLIGGHSNNFVFGPLHGVTIAGGGSAETPNRVVGSFGAVGGGSGNTAGPYATVAGGSRNQANGQYATVAGGWFNSASAERSTVGGGNGNWAADQLTTVAGGLGNSATNAFASVSGGARNIAGGTASTVCGGDSNAAMGYRSMVAGGGNNAAAGSWSLAAGNRAKANHDGAFVWADSTDADFPSTANNQFLIRAERVGIGLNNPQKKLHVNGDHLMVEGVNGEKAYFGADGGGGDMDFGSYNPAIVQATLWNQGYGGTMDLHVRTLTQTCDRNLKTNFTAVDGQELLTRIARLPIQRWQYKQEGPTTHIGPTAQDFHAAFGVGANDTTIATVDADGVALAAIQGLNQKVDEKLQQKETEIAELRKTVAELKELVSKLAGQQNGGAR